MMITHAPLTRIISRDERLLRYRAAAYVMTHSDAHDAARSHAVDTI